MKALFCTILLLPCHAASAQTPREEQPPTQISAYPSSPFEDTQGNLWFGSATEGVIRYDGTEFVSFGEDSGIKSMRVRGIMQDEAGILWFASGAGMVQYDGENFTTLANYEEYAGKTYPPGLAGNGDHLDIWDAIWDQHGTLWIATLDGVFYLEDKTFKRFHLPSMQTKHSYEFTPKMVYCILEDNDGTLWFGTDGAGVVHFNGKEQVVYTTEAGLTDNHVSSMVHDQRGDYWFGTSGGGVSRLHEGEWTTHLRFSTFQDHGVGWGRFLGILEDRHGNVWFGSSGPGGGVYRWNGEEFRYFSVDDGLGTGGVFSIKEDRSGKLWIGSTSGVFRLEGERFVNYTKTK